ncbi:GNAT family N-acetyltransferase [Bradyrhizobium sp. AUGA SZCCT0222]|uniref:GNAT family N-acetyltransferase n=1 Tax=Bradyrhizobium sp. AUGA SZCCT0222 TaxID=2807668 RepID=UPI001BA6CDE4|nr:GNAT family N-acetyltransferase [Bradyrhizobium sp. AUGA SZCCT0222]MBR1269499.1 GNAT family N-acetyltransferase [Bradyrhizobium sp. AUGA SZCCT0222]
MQVTVVNARELEIDRHIRLLREAFERSTWANQIGATLTREFYLWKYFSPFGEAVVSSVRDKGTIVSSVSAIPTLFRTPSGVINGWQVGDIATLSSQRSKGHYRTCLSALVEKLGSQLLVCFPNENSRRGIESQGFGLAADVLTFVRPLNPFATRSRLDDPGNNRITFGDFNPVDRDGSYSFFRSREYLEWRYKKNPACRYDIIQREEGYCVQRSFNIFGRKVGIVMEVAARSETALADLIKESESVGAGKGMQANFIMTSPPLYPSLRRRYLRLPQVLLPKRQSLYFRAPGAEQVPADWNVQIGDWDGL